MELSEKELINLWKTASPDVLKKLGIHDAAQRAAEQADESLQERRELTAQLQQTEKDISRLRAQRHEIKKALKALRRGVSRWDADTLCAGVDLEIRTIIGYFRELLEANGYNIEYRKTKALGQKDGPALISLWPRKTDCEIGIDNAYVFGVERIRELETLGQVAPDSFVCEWYDDYLTKEDKTLGSQANGQILVAATFQHIHTLELARRISASVLKMGDVLNGYWQWYDAHDIDNTDIWIRNPKKMVGPDNKG